MRCPKCKCDVDSDPPSNVPEDLACETCGFRIPDKVYLTRHSLTQRNACVKCRTSAKQIGKYCLYCLDHK